MTDSKLIPREMFDSVNIFTIPKPLPARAIVAYYCDGPRAVATRAQVQEQFPGTRLNPIDVNGTRASIARTADCETEDITPEMLEQWLTDFKNTNPDYEHGARGVVYCDRFSIPAVRIGTGRWVLGKDYYLWVATGDGSIYQGPGVIACQNIWRPGYDRSIVFSPQFLPG